MNLEHLISWKDRVISDKDKTISNLETTLREEQKQQLGKEERIQTC